MTMTTISATMYNTVNGVNGNFGGVLRKSHDGHNAVETFGQVYKAKYSLKEAIALQGAVVNAKSAIVCNCKQDVFQANTLSALKAAKEALAEAEKSLTKEQAILKREKDIQNERIEAGYALLDGEGVYEAYCHYIRTCKSVEAKEDYARKYLAMFGLDICGGIHLNAMDCFLVQSTASENVMKHRNAYKPVSHKTWLKEAMNLMLQALIECDAIDTSKYTFTGKEYTKIAKKAEVNVTANA